MEIIIDRDEETGGKRGKWVLRGVLAVVLGVILGTAGFLGFWAVRVVGQGYDWGDLRVAFENGIQREVAERGYSRTVGEALSSEEFLLDNLEEYYGVEFVEVEDLTGRINRLTEVGYGAEEINLMNQKLGDEEVEWVAEQGYVPKLGEMLRLDYFRGENLGRYVAAAREKDYEEWQGLAADGEAEQVVLGVNIGLDLEPYEDATEVREFDELMLVNKYHFLGEEFVPEGLRTLRADCVKGGQDLRLTEVAAQAFEEMCLAARAEGLSLVANSAERGYREQKEVMEESARQFGREYAEEYVSRPGFSEHQTGLALDVAAANADYFPVTPEYQWVLTNAPKYGFILRYLEGKEGVTGFNPEAWHLRYVGTEVAEEITEQGWTLEEYLARQR